MFRFQREVPLHARMTDLSFGLSKIRRIAEGLSISKAHDVF